MNVFALLDHHNVLIIIFLENLFFIACCHDCRIYKQLGFRIQCFSQVICSATNSAMRWESCSLHYKMFVSGTYKNRQVQLEKETRTVCLRCYSASIDVSPVFLHFKGRWVFAFVSETFGLKSNGAIPYEHPVFQVLSVLSY